jgi:hypothetical protein
MQLFINWEGALQANVDGLQCISLKCVARLVADPEDRKRPARSVSWARESSL